MNRNESVDKKKFAIIGIPVTALVAAGMCGAQIWLDMPRPVGASSDEGTATTTAEALDGSQLMCTEKPKTPPSETPLPSTATEMPQPSETPIPPTETSLPPTETPIPPTETSLPPTETTVPSIPTETETNIPTGTSLPPSPTNTTIPPHTPTGTMFPSATPTHTPEPVEEKLPTSGGEDPVSENAKKALAAAGLLATYITARKVGLWRREDDREGDAP